MTPTAGVDKISILMEFIEFTYFKEKSSGKWIQFGVSPL